jgi:hypothetical protein
MRFRRRLWIVSLAVAIVLGAAVTIAWYLATRQLMTGFADWQAALRESGWRVDAGEPVASGWPFAATVTVPAVTIDDGARAVPGGVDWSAASVRLRIAAWHPGTLVASVHGRQSLGVGGERTEYAAEWMAVAIPLKIGKPPQSADVTVKRLRVGAGGVESLRALLSFPPATSPGASTVGLSLHAEAITLTGEAARPLGSRIGRLGLEAALSGTLAPSRDAKALAASWRASGGSLRIQDFQLLWGPLDFSASGTLALDENLQPEGEGNAHAVGYAETLDALATHAAISRSAATAAKAVLSLLASYPADGGAPSVDVPLTLKDRTLAMHQVPLLRLPQIDLP